MHLDNITLTVVALNMSKVRGEISVPVSEIQLVPDYGIVGNTNMGKTRVRSTGAVVTNIRHFTAVHPRELGEVADAMGVPIIDPRWIKANICFACPEIENFTKTLVEGTQLLDTEGRSVLEIKGKTIPCLKSGQRIAAQLPHLSVKAQLFPKAAHGRRGVFGIALEEFTIRLYDTFTVRFP